MKILHVCLAAFYIDNYGYQENILPKMHSIQGHHVEILASTETYLNGNEMKYLEPSTYKNEDGIKVTRVPYVKIITSFITRKLRLYKGVKKHLDNFKPDIIFIHDVQFLGIFSIIRFLKKNTSVKVYVDGHADFTNSATNWISKNILHRLIYKYCAKSIDKYVTKFYGTLPCRVDFFKNFYEVNKNKVELLIMGVDDTLIEFDRDKIKYSLYDKHNIKESDFTIISGGKINKKKNIHFLIDAVVEIDRPNLKLIIFGKADDEVKKMINDKLKHNSIIYLGWLDNIEVHKYLSIADICVFPGKHSVLWEQAAGLGKAALFKKIEGHEHINLDGNCILLEKGDKNEIKEKILNLIDDNSLLKEIQKNALSKAKKYFSYYEIAKKSIDIN